MANPRNHSTPKSSSRERSSTATHSVAGVQPAWWIVAIMLSLVVVMLYARGFHAPLIFDDDISLIKNTSIRSLWPPIGTVDNRGPLNPEHELPTSGRPLVNLSFAVNYHFSQLRPYGYHLVNSAIHLLTSLLLWSTVRRTLRLPYFEHKFDTTAGWLALAISVLWTMHPLQTEAVIYITQRTELMVSFCYVATLYCSLRYWQAVSPSRNMWLALAVIACACGMACKEIMVSAPLIVLLFDRTFVSGSLAAALRRSWPFYVGLLSTVLVLVLLNLGTPRSQSAGFHLGVSPTTWWMTQSQALWMYLKLVVWPYPLLVHYEFPYLTTFGAAWPYVLPTVFLAAGTIVLLWQNRPLGFLGTFAFAILSPTLLIPITTEMAAERRMYLPLMAILSALVIGGFNLFQRLVRSKPLSTPSAKLAAAGILLVLFGASFAISARRVETYNDPMKLWGQVLRFEPENHVAHQNLGYLLQRDGKLDEAIEHYRQAVRIAPGSIQGHVDLASIYILGGKYTEAVEALREAVRQTPNDGALLNNLASALQIAKRFDEALPVFQRSLELEPNNGQIHKNYGITLLEAGKPTEAVQALERALALNPQDFDIYRSLGKAYAGANQKDKALSALEKGLALAKSAGDAQTTAKFQAELSKIQ